MSNFPKPLPPEKLYSPCDLEKLSFRTTAELAPLDEIIGQDRAVQAVRFAVGMHHKGFNLFVLGPEGTGRYTLVRKVLEEKAAQKPVPDDWCYVNNFVETHKPVALCLPPGRARLLREGMEQLIDDLSAAIPAAFESDEFRNRKNAIEEQIRERHEEIFGSIQKRAEKRDVTLIRTPLGLALAPVHDGDVLNSKEFESLPEEEKAKRKEAIEELQAELGKILEESPNWEKGQRRQIRDLVREATCYAVDHLINDLRECWEDLPQVIEYIEAVRDDVIDHTAHFMPEEQDGAQALFGAAGTERSDSGALRRYKVNVLVDNGKRLRSSKAPYRGVVVNEDHPTQPNLVGRIEHQSQFGTLSTDFNLIKAGALHRANGGYLVLDARKVLMQPFAWETLKRIIQAGHIRIESPAESLGWASTQTLEPEPIPLDVKVVMLGEPMLYYMLNHHDPDFRELFKVAAEFDTRIDRDESGILHYARLIAGVAKQEGLRALTRESVGRVVEHGARLTDDAEKLTSHMSSIVDLIREANFWAEEAGANMIHAKHIQKAISAKEYRSNRLSQRIQEEILRGTLLIETEGDKVGQVNGLAVITLDHFTFGKPSRISCNVHLGKGEVIDIEREVALGGPLHTKGVMILGSFLAQRFARERPLSLSASLVFEQSYGGVDGDSASSAELYALLSAISGLPLKQGLAVTGSVDQQGRVQAIGGSNEKIEGFFDICKARGLSGKEGVLIPAANVKHLMLKHKVVDAVRKGRFSIYAVETIDQGMEILTGLPAGEPGKGGNYPIGTVNRKVAAGIDRLGRKARALMVEHIPPPRPNGGDGPSRKEKKE